MKWITTEFFVEKLLLFHQEDLRHNRKLVYDVIIWNQLPQSFVYIFSIRDTTILHKKFSYGRKYEQSCVYLCRWWLSCPGRVGTRTGPRCRGVPWGPRSCACPSPRCSAPRAVGLLPLLHPGHLDPELRAPATTVLQIYLTAASVGATRLSIFRLYPCCCGCRCFLCWYPNAVAGSFGSIPQCWWLRGLPAVVVQRVAAVAVLVGVEVQRTSQSRTGPLRCCYQLLIQLHHRLRLPVTPNFQSVNA